MPRRDGERPRPHRPLAQPPPADYRKGQFKFTSTGLAATPSLADLLRTLKHGVENTSMPSFALLPEQEQEHVVSYIIHLSLRGQAEEATMVPLLSKQDLEVEGDAASVDAYLQDRVRLAVLGKSGLKSGWAAANKTVLEPKSPGTAEYSKEDVAIGYRLFLGDGACIKCHEDFGRKSVYRYDAWGTLVQPRNLTAGEYRGGRRPIDLFWRIKGGIAPSTMPGIGDDVGLLTKEERQQVEAEKDAAKAAELKTRLTHANVWRLVAFVRSVPYPAMLPDQVRREVYSPQLAQKE